MDIFKIFKSEIHLIIMEISEKEVTDKFSDLNEYELLFLLVSAERLFDRCN